MRLTFSTLSFFSRVNASEELLADGQLEESLRVQGPRDS
jgi:hypothetical protein